MPGIPSHTFEKLGYDLVEEKNRGDEAQNQAMIFKVSATRLPYLQHGANWNVGRGRIAEQALRIGSSKAKWGKKWGRP